jgi:predicted  nucleic acid-binding Zn-ribbon protein
MAGAADIEQLRAEARYARERYDLYRAKMYGSRPTSMTRLRELEREHEGAEGRLRRAEQALHAAAER